MDNIKIIVIGGGIHGTTAALALTDISSDIQIIEKNSDIFLGTSGSTHNRAHLGYHYPRSMDTVEECILGLNYFKNNYPEALEYPHEVYYAIEKEESLTSTQKYIDFCTEMNIPFKREWPDKKFLSRNKIDSSFLVPEPCFNLFSLKKGISENTKKKGINIRLNSQMIDCNKNSDGTFTVKLIHNGSIEIIHADLIINATYAYSNNILKNSHLEEDYTEYVYHTTEVVVVISPILIPALTVMDGPFISVMPYIGMKDHYLVYDVVHSVLHKSRGFSYDNQDKPPSNWKLMKNHGLEYYPFMRSLTPVKSLRGSRPILTDDTIDSRFTRIKSHKKSKGFYSILEGKFISAPLVANQLVKLIKEEML